MNGTDLGITRRGFFGAAALLAAPSFIRAAAPKARRFRAGAATSNITLPLGTLNGGVIARGGPATHIHDELHVRCLALDD